MNTVIVVIQRFKEKHFKLLQTNRRKIMIHDYKNQKIMKLTIVYFRFFCTHQKKNKQIFLRRQKNLWIRWHRSNRTTIFFELRKSYRWIFEYFFFIFNFLPLHISSLSFSHLSNAFIRIQLGTLDRISFIFSHIQCSFVRKTTKKHISSLPND